MANPVEPWIPDLCRLPRLLTVLFFTELIVVAIALAASPPTGFDADRFLATSAFALWTALVSCVLLCQLRRPLSRLPQPLGVPAAVALPMLVTAGFAWAVRELALGSLLPAIPDPQGAGGILGITVLAGILGACVLRYFYVLEQWAAQIEASSRASLDALQARIRPHFLFNSLNSIASLVRIDPIRAERAVENLSDLFRAALAAGDRDTTLGEELELSRRYLAIEALRLGERLEMEWNLDDRLPLDYRIPALLIQPLLENAVNHGIARLPAGGKITVDARLEQDSIEISIGNPTLPRRDAPSNGHALRSISQRLAYYYRSGARLESLATGTHYTCALSLPFPGSRRTAS